jgi:hypothetical protein
MLALGQPALSGVEGDEERAAEDDVGDGVEAARREVLRAADEVAGGVVDEAVSAPPAQTWSMASWIASGTRMSQAMPTTLAPWASESSLAVSSMTLPRRPQM